MAIQIAALKKLLILSNLEKSIPWYQPEEESVHLKIPLIWDQNYHYPLNSTISYDFQFD